MGVVVIELYGVPRLRAGRDAVPVEASSLGEALSALGACCPALAPSVIDGGRLGPHYLVAVNGLQLTVDPATPLADGDVVVLMAADAGG